MKNKKLTNILKFFLCIILGIFLGNYFNNILLLAGIGMLFAIFIRAIDNK